MRSSTCSYSAKRKREASPPAAEACIFRTRGRESVLRRQVSTKTPEENSRAPRGLGLAQSRRQTSLRNSPSPGPQPCNPDGLPSPQLPNASRKTPRFLAPTSCLPDPSPNGRVWHCRLREAWLRPSKRERRQLLAQTGGTKRQAAAPSRARASGRRIPRSVCCAYTARLLRAAVATKRRPLGVAGQRSVTGAAGEGGLRQREATPAEQQPTPRPPLCSRLRPTPESGKETLRKEFQTSPREVRLLRKRAAAAPAAAAAAAAAVGDSWWRFRVYGQHRCRGRTRVYTIQDRFGAGVDTRA